MSNRDGGIRGSNRLLKALLQFGGVRPAITRHVIFGRMPISVVAQLPALGSAQALGLSFWGDDGERFRLFDGMPIRRSR